MHRLTLLTTLLATSTTLLACTDDEPLAVAPLPYACGHLACELQLPIATGGAIAITGASPGAAAAATSDPAIATVSPAALGGWLVTTHAAGSFDFFLLDEAGAQIGVQGFEVVDADRLQVGATIVTGDQTLERLSIADGDHHFDVPASSFVELSVQPARGNLRLHGVLDFDVTVSAAAGESSAREIQPDGDVQFTVRAPGDSVIEFVVGDLRERVTLTGVTEP